MKRKASTLIFILAMLILSVAGTRHVNFGEANPIGPPSNLMIKILSPKNSVYYTNTIVLNFTIARNGWMNDVRYSLDGGGYGALTDFTEIKREPMPPTEPTGELWQMYNWTRYTYLGTKVFKGLSDKNHSLSVYYGHEDPDDKSFLAYGDPVTVSFIIDTSLPVVKSLVAENETYITSTVPLNFTVNKATSWMSYRLDSGANFTIYGNTTLKGIAEGLHNIVIYANDTAGNIGASETLTFTISEPEQSELESFPIILVTAASVATVVVVSLSVLVYFKKRKRVWG